MIDLLEIPRAEMPDITARFADYLAELGVASDGPDPYFKSYWQEERRWPFWLVRNSDRIGFAFMWRDGDEMELAEFCIFKPWRGAGLGRAAASAAFLRHSGKWRLGVLDSNTAALGFWRAILPAGAELANDPGEFEFRVTSEGKSI